MIYRDLDQEMIINRIEKFTKEHQQILDKLYNNEIVYEKDNSYIEDILQAFEEEDCYIRECDELVKNICIGYCIIPLCHGYCKIIMSP